jgi:NTE family protein
MKIDLLNLLKSCKIFSSLDDALLRNLLKNFKKIYLDKNKILFKQGELSNHLYLVVNGKIAHFLTTEKNEIKLINETLPGQIIGELTALSHEPRSTTAKAVKCSVVLKLESEIFIKLCRDFPAISLEIMDTSLSHSRNIIKLISDKGYARKHIAIIPANLDINLNDFHEAISKHIKKCSDIVFLSDLSDEFDKEYHNLYAIKQYIDKTNGENKKIVYLITSYNSNLAEICFGLERVDMIYVVASGDSKPALSQQTRNKIDINSYKINPELILLHDKENRKPQYTSRWLKLARFNMHHHIRIHQERDWQRLIRFITGNAVGLVLGGGGLRCWAQLGAIMALHKMNIPIDAIGGTSAGAIVAGYYAMNESYKKVQNLRELSEITRQSISLKNLTWPAASLMDGKDFTEKLQKIFGKTRIENLWIPCFCVSTKLSSNKPIVSRRGYLWKLIRSSTSVPLIFPPVVVKGELYLDGALLNNLPVDVMKKIVSDKGKVIAIELTHANEDDNKYNFPPVLPFIKTALAKSKLAYKDYVFPHLIDTFLKSLLAGSSAKQEENGFIADILVSPDLSKFNLFHLRQSDEIKLIRIGYKSTLKKIKNVIT